MKLQLAQAWVVATIGVAVLRILSGFPSFGSDSNLLLTFATRALSPLLFGFIIAATYLLLTKVTLSRLSVRMGWMHLVLHLCDTSLQSWHIYQFNLALAAGQSVEPKSIPFLAIQGVTDLLSAALFLAALLLAVRSIEKQVNVNDFN